MFKNIFQGLFKIFRKNRITMHLCFVTCKIFHKISERKNKQNLKESNQGNNDRQKRIQMFRKLTDNI